MLENANNWLPVWYSPDLWHFSNFHCLNTPPRDDFKANPCDSLNMELGRNVYNWLL